MAAANTPALNIPCIVCSCKAARDSSRDARTHDARETLTTGVRVKRSGLLPVQRARGGELAAYIVAQRPRRQDLGVGAELHYPAPDFAEPGRLTLAVEVLSPSTARVDHYRKRPLFQTYRVHEYWIVDVANRLIARWRPDDTEPDVLLDTMSWQPVGEPEPLQIDLAEYFSDVHRDGEGTRRES